MFSAVPLPPSPSHEWADDSALPPPLEGVGDDANQLGMLMGGLTRADSTPIDDQLALVPKAELLERKPSWTRCTSNDAAVPAPAALIDAPGALRHESSAYAGQLGDSELVDAATETTFGFGFGPDGIVDVNQLDTFELNRAISDLSGGLSQWSQLDFFPDHPPAQSPLREIEMRDDKATSSSAPAVVTAVKPPPTLPPTRQRTRSGRTSRAPATFDPLGTLETAKQQPPRARPARSARPSAVASACASEAVVAAGPVTIVPPTYGGVEEKSKLAWRGAHRPPDGHRHGERISSVDCLMVWNANFHQQGGGWEHPRAQQMMVTPPEVTTEGGVRRAMDPGYREAAADNRALARQRYNDKKRCGRLNGARHYADRADAAGKRKRVGGRFVSEQKPKFVSAKELSKRRR